MVGESLKCGGTELHHILEAELGSVICRSFYGPRALAPAIYMRGARVFGVYQKASSDFKSIFF